MIFFSDRYAQILTFHFAMLQKQLFPIGDHNREAQRGNKTGNNREMKSGKKNRFFILFSCFKIMSVHKSKEKKRKSQIFEIFF